MSNLVWRKYVINKMPYWVEWFKNNHFQSYIEMLHRFIITNPYYLPKDNDSALFELGSDLDFFDIDEDFFDSLTDKGLKVWYNSDFQDFMYELQIVGGEQQEIKKLLKLYNRFPWWFNRCYSKVHENLAQYFESEGRNFK